MVSNTFPMQAFPRHVFVEGVAHGLDEYRAWPCPMQRLRQTLRPQSEAEPVLERMTWHALKAFALTRILAAPLLDERVNCQGKRTRFRAREPLPQHRKFAV
jgi:hypothetical protein